MAASIVAPVLPEIARVFADIPGSDLLSKMVISLPAIFIALSAPIAGRMIDKHGRLKYLFAALLVYAISGTSAYYLNDIYAILVGRAILGISIGTILTITITLIGDYFEGEERQKFIGLQSAFIGFSGIIFLASGGFLADISWRSPFLIYLFSLILIPLTAKYLVEPKRVSQPAEAGAFKVGKLLKIVFATATSYMILFYIVPTQLPFLLKEIGFNANSLTGTILSLNALGMVISALMYSRLKSRFSFPVVLSIGLALMATGFVIISFANALPLVVTSMIINGFGIGLMMPNINLWAIELTEPAQRGKTLGMLTMCLFIGQFLSPIVMQPVVGAVGLTGLFLSVGVMLTIMAALFLVFRRKLG